MPPSSVCALGDAAAAAADDSRGEGFSALLLDGDGKGERAVL